MRSNKWSKGLMSMLGLCAIVGALLTSGCAQGGDDAAFAAPTSGGASDQLSSWSQKLPGAGRFLVLPAFETADNGAVLDRETGLVWEKSPSPPVPPLTQGGAAFVCANKNIGGRKGWRLPAIAELASLIDPSVPSPGPMLPPGHPFLNVRSGIYWSSSATHTVSGFWVASFGDGEVSVFFQQIVPAHWCVRGPMQESLY